MNKVLPIKYIEDIISKIKNYYRNKGGFSSFFAQNDFWQKIVSISVSSDRALKIITILGIKIKIARYHFNPLIVNIKYPKIQKNKIVFSNYMGKSYGCNPKYIADEILKQGLNYDLVWLVRDADKVKADFPKGIRLVEWMSKDAFKELFTAKLWIDNTRKKPYYQNGLYKRKHQKYIQTWHGSLGIKKIEAAIKSGNTKWRKWAKVDSKYIDYILSNSKHDDLVYSRDFWYNGEIVRTGDPRNDIFFTPQDKLEEDKKQLMSELNIAPHKKLVLYAPTFRDDGDTTCYSIDTERCLKNLEKRFGNEFVFLIKFHPNVNLSRCQFTCNKNVIDVNDYNDTIGLLSVADVVISDYSSCMIDFMLTKRPAFIYAVDLDKVRQARNFYYPIESTPFPIALNNDELENNILNFNNEKYLKNIERFMKTHDCMEDGHSSERAVELVKKIMGEIK